MVRLERHRLLWIAVLALPLLGIDDCRQRPSSMLAGHEVKIGWTVPPFTWKARMSQLQPALTATPGSPWSVGFDVEVDLERYAPKYGKFTHIIVGIFGERRYDKDGFYRSGASTLAISSNFTTTGVPIERFTGWPRFKTLHGREGSPFEATKSFSLPPQDQLAAKHRFKGRLKFKVPPDLSHGFYEPLFYVFVRVEGVKDPVHLALYGYEWNGWYPPSLPLVKVGSPATPRVPWTIMSQYHMQGRSGTLPEEYRGRAEVCRRSGFPSRFIMPPGTYRITPNLPSIFPQSSMSALDGGLDVITDQVDTFIDLHRGSVRCSIKGPSGISRDLGTTRFSSPMDSRPQLVNRGFKVDMTRTGEYQILLWGKMKDAFGRPYLGGGTYRVTIAHPLTFSTSCKPGTSYLVGGVYPPKVNLNPPFPGEVKVMVDYYPDSDPARKRTWVGRGRANRFGHFLPYDPPPLRFDEPGEYFSRVTARYTDARGRLWMGEQTSTGVIASKERIVELHGMRSFPYNNRMEQHFYGAKTRFADRANILTSFMPDTPYMLSDPFVPYYPQDTLYIPSNISSENIIEPHLSMKINDPVLARKMMDAYTIRSMLVPDFYQPVKGPWRYLKDVVELSTDSFGWFPVSHGKNDHLPVMSVGKDGFHPLAFPEHKRMEIYTYLGIVRPGFIVETNAYENEAIGYYWLASPNRYGRHFGAGVNGDLPGDVYRIQAGAVFKDLETGKNYYDALSTAVSVIAADGGDNATSILPPGKRPQVVLAGREQMIYVALDPHDVLEVGELMSLGGMVFPAIPADVTWDVTKPSGEKVVVRGKANRLGSVGGRPRVQVDQPGIYAIKASVRYQDLRGDIVGTRDGSYWHCAVAKDNPKILRTSLAPMIKVDSLKGFRIPLTWPKELRKVKVHYAMMMPGQVLDAGVHRWGGSRWEYPFDPVQLAYRFPNFDARDFATGQWKLGETVVFQFFLEGEGVGGKVFDALRLVLRHDRLYNYRGLMAPAEHPGKKE